MTKSTLIKSNIQMKKNNKNIHSKHDKKTKTGTTTKGILIK